jgi:hypothetical protein
MLAFEGYKVEVKTALYQGVLDQTRLDSANAAALIIISRAANSGMHNEPAQWNGINAPIICMSPWVLRSNRWMWFNTESIDTIGDYIQVVDPGDPIFDGVVESLFSAYMDPYSEIFAVADAGNGKVIATDPVSGNLVMASWEAGQEFYAGSGQTAAAKRIFFAAGRIGPAEDCAQLNLTFLGQTLFLNAVKQFFQSSDLGLENDVTDNPISIYPNPVQDILKLNIQPDIGNNVIITIMNISGLVVYEKIFDLSHSTEHLDINLAGMATGIYMLSFDAGEKKIFRKFAIR